MARRRLNIATMMIAVALLIVASGCASSPKTAGEREEARAELRAMATETLVQLYGKNPAARDAITGAAGYAVFKNFGFKIIYGGASRGKGMAVENRTRQETFMKMTELQPGLGLGAAKFRAVLVFENPASFKNFVDSGWIAGANVMAAAKTVTEGGGYQGAVNLSEGVYMYQLTQEGFIVGVSLTGAKYSQDEDLN